ncbi:MAG: type II toxin-antitoxin system RelE/ParE family toxin [Bifidobacterium sp.]|nr:type II toxin-antitoxin system RelE/ParE family toxin [Bifidobacterium sp.]
MKTRTSELNAFLYGGPYPRGYPQGLQKVLMRKLQMLKAAYGINDLRVPPSNHLEKLKGDLAGYWSIRVNDQYRLVFIWDDSEREAIDVHFVDYHD